MSRHRISFQELIDWAEGRLSGSAAERVTANLAESDLGTRRTKEWIQAFLDASRQTVLEASPQAVRAEVRARFLQAALIQRQRPEWRLVVARPLFDSAARVATAGVRSGGLVHQPRHLVYTTDVADVTVDVHRRPNDSHVDVLGQLFPNDSRPAQSFRVELSRGDTTLGAIDADELGEFSFANVHPGDYHMILSTGKLGILVTPVHLNI